VKPDDLPPPALRQEAPGVEESALTVLGALEHLSVERDRDGLNSGMLRIAVDLSGAIFGALYLRVEDSFAPALAARADAVPFRPSEGLPDLPDEFAIDGLRQSLALAPAAVPMLTVDEHTVVHGLVGPLGLTGILLLRFAPGMSTRPWWLSSFLKVCQNYINLISDAECDTLTGLFNRKTFEGRMSQVLAMQRGARDAGISSEPGRRAVRPGEHHWLAVIDIDHFKSINDRFGHLYGDEVLILMARLMMRGFRMEDRLFRFGGEEFVIVLSPCTEAGAATVLERFRTSIATYEFPQVGRVTASIGYTRIGKGDVASVTVGRADEALYYAKRNGRNRVCSYELLKASGAIRQAGADAEGAVTLF
jgi:diguanylate cyclase (GGDEF)-like protein